jgi:hypothetical protein
MTTLLELMRKHKTDKAVHRYDIPYGFLLDDRRHQVTRVLELGIKRGESLRLWEEYFPEAEIFGVDIQPKWARSASARSRVFIGSQADETLLQEVSAAAGFRFDLIVDDGSHMSDHQVASLTYLWQYLTPQHGIYAIEDLNAPVKYPVEFSHRHCRYPPMADMLVRSIERTLATDVCPSGVPGVVVYGAIALLLKGENGPAPAFDEFLGPE